jgi:hypothetical protein
MLIIERTLELRLIAAEMCFMRWTPGCTLFHHKKNLKKYENITHQYQNLYNTVGEIGKNMLKQEC